MKLFVVALLSSLQDIDNSTDKLVFRPLLHPPRIYEGAPPGVHVTTVHAYNPDNPRKKVIYNLPSVLDFQYFVLDQNSGNLTTAKKIERTVDEVYQVMAAAVSSGLSELEHLQIVVTEFNQFAPRFEKPVYRVELPLQATAGELVLQLRAVDPDPVPLNAEIYYRMDQNVSTNFFSLDPFSGELTLAQPLNTTENELVFGVFAEDGGSPKRWAHVQVEIFIKTITRPEDVRVTNITVTSAVICWNTPEFGFVNEYLVEYKIVGSFEQNSVNVTSEEHETCTMLGDLQGGQKYEFSVAGTNFQEIGQKTPSQYFETIADPCTQDLCSSGNCVRVNVDPWYLCDCEDGYYGSHCELFDVCSQSPCQNEGMCVNITHNDYVCICTEGYTGHNCDIYNPCTRESHVCKNGGTCEMMSDRSYLCLCPNGYYGSHCQNKDPCFTKPCYNGGTCKTKDDHDFSCSCSDGYFGLLCEKKDPCFTKPCYNGGVCEVMGDYSYQCSCPDGYYGDGCENKDPCLSSPCYNGGTCEMTDHYSYICQCSFGYYGEQCEKTDPCFANPCYNGGSCKTSGDHFFCECPPGYQGEICEGINPCFDNPCYNGGTCVAKGDKSFSCLCPEGYDGNLCETKDLCFLGPCQNGGTCVVASENVYSCACPDGYYGENCEMKNACLENPCQNKGTCKTTGDSLYSCSCLEGYYGTNCEKRNLCSSKPCLNGGECKEISGHNYQCLCSEGFYGERCENKDPCFKKPCYNGGTCQATDTQGYTCYCVEGYYGPLCENKDPCLAKSCYNGGTCEMKDDNTYVCICVDGYYGALCENKDPCSGRPCYNGGECERTGDSYVCVCPEGFYGTLCQNKDPCLADPCYNGGTCEVTTETTFLCICPEEFYGPFCQNRDACFSKPCHNGGTCRNVSDTSFVCICPPGYEGETCERETDDCSSNPCHSSATCIDMKNDFSCICPTGYSGRTCNISEQCSDDVTEGDEGRFIWKKTNFGSTAMELCPYGSKDTEASKSFATRTCFLETGNFAKWGPVNATACRKNAVVLVLEKVAENLQNLTKESAELTEEKIVTATKTISSIISVAAQDKKLAQDVVNVFSKVLDVNTDVMEKDKDGTFRESLLQIVDEFASSMPLKRGQSTTLETENLRIQAVNWHPDVPTEDTKESDSGLKFEFPAVTSSAAESTGEPQSIAPISPETFEGDRSTEQTTLAPTEEKEEVSMMQVFVPQSALQEAHRHLKTEVRVNLMVYYNDKLFQPKKRNETMPAMQAKPDEAEISKPSPADTSSVVKVPVLKINVGNISLSNLEQPLVYIIPLPFKKKAKCVFWREKNREWSTEGLSTNQTEKVVICESSHLTAFSVLLDPTPEVTISAAHEEALSLISYVGCALSVLGLFLTILTYSLFRCLNRDHSGKILLNLCLSLLLMNLTFLMGAMRPEDGRNMCAAVALLLHFFLLSSLSWMCVEAVNMYQLLVHVFASSETHFLLKRCLLAWGGPFVIVGATVAASFRQYFESGPNCMLSPKHPWVYYCAFLAPCCIILAVNVTVFVLVSRVLFGPRLASQSSYNGNHVITATQVRGAFTVLILLGVTWVFGTFAVGEAKLIFQYVFCVTNSLQGFLIFLVRCLLYPEARGAWVQLIKYGKLKKYRGVLPTGAVSWSMNSQSAAKQNGKTATSTVRKYSNEGMGTVVFNSNFWNRSESRGNRMPSEKNGGVKNGANSNVKRPTRHSRVKDNRNSAGLNNCRNEQNEGAGENGIFVTDMKDSKSNKDFCVFWRREQNCYPNKSENEDKNETNEKVKSAVSNKGKIQNNKQEVRKAKEHRSASVDIFCTSTDPSDTDPTIAPSDSLKGFNVLCLQPDAPFSWKSSTSKEQRSGSLDTCISHKSLQARRSSADAYVRHPQNIVFYRSSSKFKRKTPPVIEKVEELQSDNSDSTDVDECPLESPLSHKPSPLQLRRNSSDASRESIRI